VIVEEKRRERRAASQNPAEKRGEEGEMSKDKRSSHLDSFE
jgi:hypothetical protein